MLVGIFQRIWFGGRGDVDEALEFARPLTEVQKAIRRHKLVQQTFTWIPYQVCC
jgi:hypothetical protein